MKHRSEAISKLLEGLDTIVASHAKRTLEEDRYKEKESKGEQPIESTKDYVEKYEVEANLPEGHSEEAEEAGAERSEKRPETEMPEYPGKEAKEHTIVGTGGVYIKPLPQVEEEKFPPKEPKEPKEPKKPEESEDEMSQAKRELMDRLAKKPKAIRR